jgi:hypothetical protein
MYASLSAASRSKGHLQLVPPKHHDSRAAIGALRKQPPPLNPLAANMAPKPSFSSLGSTNPSPPCSLAQALARPLGQRQQMDMGSEGVNAKRRFAEPLLPSSPNLASPRLRLPRPSNSMFSQILGRSCVGGHWGQALIKQRAAIGAPLPKLPHPKAQAQGLKGRCAPPRHPRPPKKGQKRKLDHQNVDSDPGSVFESSLRHMKRHQDQAHARVCLRCQYLSHPKRLEQCAKLPHATGKAETWLEPRPEFKGGRWALGCRICAWYHVTARCQGNCKIRKHLKNPFKKAHNNNADARFGKFANFDWRCPQGFRKNLEQHGHSKAHDIACRAMMCKADYLGRGRPESKESAAHTPPTMEPDMAFQTFKGRVPKPEAWLDCYVEAKERVSWRKQARLSIAKSGKTPAPDPGEPLATSKAPKQDHLVAAPKASKQGQPLAAPRASFENLRKTRRKQTRFIAECVRKRHRQVLRKARFCSLALDEAQGRKLIRFRCDFHKPPWNYSGVLGVLEMGPKTLEEGEEDHALRAMKRLDEFITKFCTPLRKKSLGTECDQELKDHLLKIVKTISADGGPAERRALFLACELGFPAGAWCPGHGTPTQFGLWGWHTLNTAWGGCIPPTAHIPVWGAAQSAFGRSGGGTPTPPFTGYPLHSTVP